MADRPSQLRGRVEKQWQDLPAHFRRATSLPERRTSPFQRDFLAGTRLDYLHILFLLGLVSEPGLFGPNDDLLMVATEMLSIVVEVIILRDQLVNSGSCLIWKVSNGTFDLGKSPPFRGNMRSLMLGWTGRAIRTARCRRDFARTVKGNRIEYASTLAFKDDPRPQRSGCRDQDRCMDPGWRAKFRFVHSGN